MRKNRTHELTAELLIEMFHNSKKEMGNFSLRTLRLLSKRHKIEGAFTDRLEEYLSEHGFVLNRIDHNNFVFAPLSRLLAPSNKMTAKKFLPKQARKRVIARD